MCCFLKKAKKKKKMLLHCSTLLSLKNNFLLEVRPPKYHNSSPTQKSSLKGDEQEIRWKRKRRHSLSDLARVSCTSAAGTELISVVWAWGEIHDWFQQKSQSDKTLQMSSAQPEHQRPLHILHWSHHTCCF